MKEGPQIWSGLPPPYCFPVELTGIVIPEALGTLTC